MLILTRNVGESVVIGEKMDISVVIRSIHGNQVKIGIEAPKNVPVHREEIEKRIIREKESLQPKPRYDEVLFESKILDALV